MDILTLNKISKIGLKEFDSSYNILEECENPQGIIVRSASMHEYEFSNETFNFIQAVFLQYRLHHKGQQRRFYQSIS